jgi:hypothetical protein
MRHNRKLAVGTIATAAVLIGSSSDGPHAGQEARGSLAVTVQVITACGGSLSQSRTVTQSECARGSTPLAVASESAPATSRDDGALAQVEPGSDVRYVTLIYCRPRM